MNKAHALIGKLTLLVTTLKDTVTEQKYRIKLLTTDLDDGDHREKVLRDDIRRLEGAREYFLDQYTTVTKLVVELKQALEIERDRLLDRAQALNDSLARERDLQRKLDIERARTTNVGSGNDELIALQNVVRTAMDRGLKVPLTSTERELARDSRILGVKAYQKRLGCGLAVAVAAVDEVRKTAVVAAE
jgi:chromosome segregation ATPase